MADVTPGIWTHDGETAEVWPGRNYRSARLVPESTNFAVYAPRATALQVCAVRRRRHRDGVRAHRALAGDLARRPAGRPVGTLYGYRADGPWVPDLGLRFNRHKLLLDPYAQAVCGDVTTDPAIFGHVDDNPAQMSELDSAPYVPRSVVVDPTFDWGGDRPMFRRWRDTAIYEVHVKGMTMLHDRVPEELRGTYAGLAAPAVTDYLHDLGITAVELLPIQQFFSEPALAERGLVNYWGYNSLGFFAPHNAYSHSGDRGQQVAEFKQMVKSFHEAGLEVILDVVYNHTAEAGPLGPTLQLPRARRPRLLPAGRGRPRHGGDPRCLLGRHRLRQHGRRHAHRSRCG